MPEMMVSDNFKKKGRPFKHSRPFKEPINLKNIIQDETIPWEKAILGEGTKGAIITETKCIRCVSCKNTTKFGNYIAPGEWIWVYIRKHMDGTIKYFISNAPEDTERRVLDRIATMRWSIEQCFQECKSYLGMAHYETRTYKAWHRHMLMVMIAHQFTICLRMALKKTLYYHANGEIFSNVCTAGTI